MKDFTEELEVHRNRRTGMNMQEQKPEPNQVQKEAPRNPNRQERRAAESQARKAKKGKRK